MLTRNNAKKTKIKMTVKAKLDIKNGNCLEGLYLPVSPKKRVL